MRLSVVMMRTRHVIGDRHTEKIEKEPHALLDGGETDEPRGRKCLVDVVSREPHMRRIYGESRTDDRGQGNPISLMLREDHQKLKELFDHFDETTNKHEKRDIATAAFAAWEVHAILEEELIYPAWREYVDERDLMDEARENHHVVHLLITELKKMDSEDERYEATWTVLREQVQHHMKEEEEKMFSQAEKAVLDWERLTTHVMQRRQRLEQQPLWLLGVPVILSARDSLCPACGPFGQIRTLKQGTGFATYNLKEAPMTPTKEYTMEPSIASVGQAAAGVIERAEERVGSIIQTMDSAVQTIQETLWRTQESASAAIGTVADGIAPSTDYLANHGLEGVVEDVEALIRRYPFQALVIGCSVGFLLSRSWKR